MVRGIVRSVGLRRRGGRREGGKWVEYDCQDRIEGAGEWLLVSVNVLGGFGAGFLGVDRLFACSVEMMLCRNDAL